MLAAEGVLLVKFWFHLSRAGQKKRLKALEANPDTRWRVRDADWLFYEEYERYRRSPSTCCAGPAPALRLG
jgi:polyphosphate kinase 2 (PPK2 family)